MLWWLRSPPTAAVLSSQPDAGACSSHDVVPNTLHRIWVGRNCPQVRDFISMLSAALLLEPQQIINWVTTLGWDESCFMQESAARQRVRLPIPECYRALGVQTNLINETDSQNGIVHVTRNFSYRRFAKRRTFKLLKAVSKTDYLRSWIMDTHGGYYFDSDVFVTSRRLRHFRRCPAVIGRNDFDMYDFTTVAPGTPQAPPSTAAPTEGEPLQLNSAMMLAVPGTSFTRSAWDWLKSWDGLTGIASRNCCNFTTDYHEKHPNEVLAAASMRNFPFCLRDRANRSMHPTARCPGGTTEATDERLWMEQIGRIVARSETHAVHLTNWKIRKFVWAPVLHFVLRNIVRHARNLTPGKQQCLDVAWRWLNATHPLHESTVAAQRYNTHDGRGEGW